MKTHSSRDKSTKRKGGRLTGAALVVGALGVVYGDIGTSPLYAVNSVFFGIGQTPVTHEHIFGVISLIFWLLTLVVTIKYITFVLRANNHGEGGVLALHELVATIKKRHIVLFLMLLLFASSLLLGDGIITPSISVLSAVEGLGTATSFFNPYTVPIAVAVLLILFVIQRKGTKKIGRIFGPIMIIWFTVIGLLGLIQITHHPEILAALNPMYAINYIVHSHVHAFLLTAGAVVLAVTGAEDLYIDLGSFGVKPIRQGWFYLVYWALILNYLGQGASLLRDSTGGGGNTFFSLVPHLVMSPSVAATMPVWLAHILVNAPTYMMVGLATIATVIASQALITGAFSLVSQAIALDLIPRLNIIHTSQQHRGQIYIPAVNWILLLGCTLLVLTFRSSNNLADAYGLAVSGVMITTTTAMFMVSRYKWGWSKWRVIPLFSAFLIIDITLLSATSLKFFTGGYIPVMLAAALFVVSITWDWGRGLVRGAYATYIASASPRNMEWLSNMKRYLMHNKDYTEQSRERRYVELDRAVVFLVSKPIDEMRDNIPVILRVFMKRHGALPRHVILLTFSQDRKPFVGNHKRIKVIDFDNNIISVIAHYGFMQRPDGLEILRLLKEQGYLGYNLHRVTVEAAEEEVFVTPGAKFIDKLRVKVYLFFKAVSPEAYHYFHLDSKPGLSKTIVPIMLGKNGWRIEIPEFALDAASEDIDPDTLLPTVIRFERKVL